MTLDITAALRVKVIEVHTSFEPLLSTKQPADVNARNVA
jgi:hypothetical protein